MTTGGRLRPPGSRRTTPAPSISCPSRNTVALTWNVSPDAARSPPPAERHVWESARSLLKATQPRAGLRGRAVPSYLSRHSDALCSAAQGTLPVRCDIGRERAARRGARLDYRLLETRIRVALRESYPPVYSSSGTARATRAAARPDAESALVMA